MLKRHDSKPLISNSARKAFSQETGVKLLIRIHTSIFICAFLAQNNTVMMPWPSYSADIEFILSVSKAKERLKEAWFYECR